MKYFILIIVLSVTFAEHINTTEDTEKKALREGIINVHGKPHMELTVIDGVNRPHHLSYYKPRIVSLFQVVYFSYNVGQQNESTPTIGYTVEPGNPTAKIHKISTVKNGFATAIDYANDIIYLGGSEGIYTNKICALTTRVGSLLGGLSEPYLFIPNRNIWDLFFKDNLYFIEFPSRSLYKVSSNSNQVELQSQIHEKLYQFVIDGDGDTFLSNKSGLFMIRKDTNNRIHIKGAKVFRAFKVSRKGVAYFCGKNKIYVADKEKESLVKIASIKNITGLTFDYDNNMYFSDPHRIAKLLPNNYTSSVEHKTPNGTSK
ncbi:ommochrome-binding protein-like [Ostrinia furnacalis]|uniref:ommochrome-binding protein-like n=1 Tax=Ostrinia furnacalis TaxID=93504 RepID=UPI0010390637|nr:ommochrome-binding protein-like [Ostrinia furnacalis]